MDDHAFEPLHFNDAVAAACSCGWVSAYLHAFEKYAEGDHAFHISLHVEAANDG